MLFPPLFHFLFLISVQRYDPTYEATRLHFEDLAKRYGNPIIVLNLIKVLFHFYWHWLSVNNKIIYFLFVQLVYFCGKFYILELLFFHVGSNKARDF